MLALEGGDAFGAKVDEYFPGLSESKRARMAQFLHDKHQELLREAGSSPSDSETGDSVG